MFYTKDNRGTRIYLDEGNVYCRCPACRREVTVDLDSILKEPFTDLHNTGVYCRTCGRRRTKFFRL